MSKEDMAVMIMDLSKLAKGEFTELFTKAGIYVARIKPESYKKVTDEVDRIQEEEGLTPETEEDYQ